MCVSKYKVSKKTHEIQKDKVRAQMIVKNAVFCLKNGDSTLTLGSLMKKIKEIEG